jgi:hypothetical protein
METKEPDWKAIGRRVRAAGALRRKPIAGLIQKPLSAEIEKALLSPPPDFPKNWDPKKYPPLNVTCVLVQMASSIRSMYGQDLTAAEIDKCSKTFVKVLKKKRTTLEKRPRDPHVAEALQLWLNNTRGQTGFRPYFRRVHPNFDSMTKAEQKQLYVTLKGQLRYWLKKVKRFAAQRAEETNLRNLITAAPLPTVTSSFGS